MTTQLLVTLNASLTMWQGTQFMMRYEALATATPRTNGIILSTEHGDALIAALDADLDVASYVPFMPVPTNVLFGSEDYAGIIDAIGVLPIAPAQPSEWDLRGSNDGE